LLFSQLSTNHIGAGNCQKFNGSTQGVDLGQSFNNLSLPVTIMAWIKADSRSTIQPIFSSSGSSSAYHGVWMHITNSRLQAGFGDGTGGFTPNARRTKIATPNFPMNGEWMHICAVIVNNNDIRLYINGIDVGGYYNGTAVNLVSNSSGSANIARFQRNATTTVYYDGSMDEVRFFDQALSVNRIREEMCLKTDVNAAGLIGAWDFNESGPISNPHLVYDLTGNNNGTSVGGTNREVSGAAVGDEAVFDYPLNSSNALALSVPGEDSIRVNFNGQLPGVQVYRVDSLPFYQNGISNSLVPGVTHYYGVYAARFNNNYNLNFEVLSPTASANTYELAYRDNATITTWSKFNGYLNNGTTQNNRGHHEEYILSHGPCTSPGILPDSIIACDTLIIQLPSYYNNPQWSDGSTASTRILTTTPGLTWLGTLIVNATSPNGCSISDTIQYTLTSVFTVRVPDQHFCDSITIDRLLFADSLVWNDGDTNRKRVFYNSGTYSYIASDPNGPCLYRDTFNLSLINTHQIASSFSGCDSVQITLPSNYNSPQWSDGSTASSRTFFTNQSNLIVTATDTSGCNLSDTINISILQNNYSPLTDQQFCDSIQISLSGLNNITWNDGSSANPKTFFQTGTYSFTANDIQNGCTIYDTVLLTRIGQSYLSPQISACDSVSISLPTNYSNPLWSDGSVANSRIFFQDTTLWVSATDTNGCTIRDTIFFDVLEAQFTPIGNRNICDSMRVNLNPSFSNILWQDGDTNHQKSIHLAGLYSYQALDSKGCFFSDTFNITKEAFSYLPDAITGCDSISISLPSNLSNPNWSDGSTAFNRTFYQSGSIQVTATDTSGCESRDTIFLNILSPTYIPVSDQETCDSLLVEPDSRLTNITWFDGSLANSRYFGESGRYWYNAVDPQNGCPMNDTFNITVLSLDTNWQAYYQTSPDITYCIGDTVKLFAPKNIQVKWPSSSDSSISIFNDKVLRVEMENNCTDTVVFLEYQFYDCSCTMYVADAFSPNGDGLNDKMKPKGVCEFTQYHWQIFNRWGQLVFETNNPEDFFDGNFEGENCPSGSYVYKLLIGNRHTSRLQTGTITIIR